MSLEKFRLLCWKNFTLQKRHPIAGLFEILFPILIVSIFVFARNNVKTEAHKELRFKGFQPEIYENCHIDKFVGENYETIGVSPGDNLAIVELINSSVGKSKIKIKFFDTARELNDFLNTVNGTVAGIEFDDHLKVSEKIFVQFTCDDIVSHLAEFSYVA